MKLKEQIIKAFNEYNEDANSKWENEKILGLCNYRESEGNISLTISIGKWQATYHDLVVYEDGIGVKAQSGYNKLLDDVIHYILNPIFFS